jgi:hypothetical protein
MANQPGTRKATAADLVAMGDSGLSVKEGDLIAPAGLYASDHDMFAFLVNEQNRLKDGTDGGLGRGMFVYNSEVGAGSFRIVRFLYRHVCGNHIVWGAEKVNEISIRHVGMADQRGFAELVVTLKKYADESAKDQEAQIARVQTIRLGADRDAVVSAVLGLRVPVLSARIVGAAWDSTQAMNGVDGDPNTAWGISNGLTRLSQSTTNGMADQRSVLDRAAGLVLAKVGSAK